MASIIWILINNPIPPSICHAAETIPTSGKNSYPISLWHHRLGHASIVKLQHIPCIQPYIKDKSQICVTCPMSKFTMLPFPASASCALAPFELIHIDIWGPYKVQYLDNYRFFFTIVDDHTRHTWVYLLQHKSDALSNLKDFFTYAKKHFTDSFKFIRSDNALEFDEKACQQFFSKNGVLHQKSCVKRPQQNARVERKHRHILEIMRSFRFHSGAPLHLWGACVMAAVHIINRLPTHVLSNRTPYELLYHTPPTYDHFKIFGCLVFASNPLFPADKFAHRGVPCVFIGYPPLKKGHLLLNLLTQKQFVSRDVIFHESIFPLHNSSTNSFMQPVPPSLPKLAQTHHDDWLPVVENIENPDTSNTTLEKSHQNSSVSSPTPPINLPVLRKSTRSHVPPIWMQDYVTSNSTHHISNCAVNTVEPKFQCFLSTLSQTHDPTSFKKAVQSED